jgi:phosphatidylserine/phosphatidylglycerophosphate/cardiolipin synthase-like enzyme
MIIDDKTVFTGSMNFSNTGLSDFNANTVIIIHSDKIANLYTKEFEQMLSGKFHNQKSSLRLQNQFDISGTKISVYFSPYDKASKHIIPLINGAKHYIYMPTFLITHTKIADALINAKRRGVDVKILMNAANTNTTHSKHEALRKAGVQLKTETFAGKMHSKTIIIDDKYIIAGSMNFSNSGENKNDENCLIIENEKLAKNYKQFFMYLWNKVPDFWLNHNAHAEGKDSVGSCSDGIDNDFDGKTDKADEGCISNLK